MSTYIKRYRKHPDEVLDCDITFDTWLNAKGDTVNSYVVEQDLGITTKSASLIDGPLAQASVVRPFISGGSDGHSYMVAAEITTAGGRVKRGEILVRVRGRQVTGSGLRTGLLSFNGMAMTFNSLTLGVQ